MGRSTGDDIAQWLKGRDTGYGDSRQGGGKAHRRNFQTKTFRGDCTVQTPVIRRGRKADEKDEASRDERTRKWGRGRRGREGW